jgi:hypothetical protein
VPTIARRFFGAAAKAGNEAPASKPADTREVFLMNALLSIAAMRFLFQQAVDIDFNIRVVLMQLVAGSIIHVRI